MTRVREAVQHAKARYTPVIETIQSYREAVQDKR